MAINHRLRRMRIQRNWRQENLAEQLNVHVTTIQRWERGNQRPTLYYCMKLCELFDTSAQELGLIEDEPQSLSERESENTDMPVSVASAEEHALWMVPFSRNPYFTGREDLLAALEEHFAGSTQAQAINGLGGIGKTQIAIEYAYRACDQKRYVHILWVEAYSKEALLISFASLYEQVYTSQAMKEADQCVLVASVIRWLERCQEPWLLIIDNANDLSFLPAYLPVRGHGNILFTTRASAVGALASSLEVEPLSLEEGTQLLLHRTLRGVSATPEERKDAGTIVKALGQLPLAIDQVGAYLEETGCRLQDYIALFQEHQCALLARRGIQASGYPNSVATTWLRSFQCIEQANPAAAEFLRLCTVVASDRLPEEVLSAGVAYWPTALREAVTDQFRFNQMMEALLAFSLVKRVSRERMLNLHPLVQKVQKASMTLEEQRQWAERLVLAVYTIFPVDARIEVESWPLCRRLLEQAQMCSVLIQQYGFQHIEAVTLLEHTGIYLRERGHYSQAEQFLRQALHLWEKRGVPEDLQEAELQLNLANLYARQGKEGLAEPLYQRALCIREQCSGPEQLEISDLLYGLALPRYTGEVAGICFPVPESTGLLPL